MCNFLDGAPYAAESFGVEFPHYFVTMVALSQPSVSGEASNAVSQLQDEMAAVGGLHFCTGGTPEYPYRPDDNLINIGMVGHIVSVWISGRSSREHLHLLIFLK